MYTATIAREENFQKYGEKSLLKLTLRGHINNYTDKSTHEFLCWYLIF